MKANQRLIPIIESIGRYQPPKLATRPERIKAKNRECEIAESIQYIFTNNNTTQAERIEVANRWLDGDFSYYVYFANARYIEPIALIAASLIEVQQARLAPDGQPFAGKFTHMVAQILQIELQALVEFGFDDGNPSAVNYSSYPVFSCKPVDNCLKTVDNSVDNLVDNSGQPVDNLAGVFE